MPIRAGFKKTKLPLDTGYFKDLPDGTRLHYHPGDKYPHIDKSNPERDATGHIINDVIGGGKGVPIKSYWTKRTRIVNGVETEVIVRKRKGKTQVRLDG